MPSKYHLASETAKKVIADLVHCGGRKGKGLVTCLAAGNHNLPLHLPAEENPEGLEYYDTKTGRVLGHFFRGKEVHSGWPEIQGVVVVGAVTSRCRKSLYSNWGRHLTVVAPSDNWHPRSLATRDAYPDARLRTADNETQGITLREAGLSKVDLPWFTEDMGGTSGATPLAAGVCALIRSVNGDLTADEVREILVDSARKDLDFALDEPDMFNNRGQDGRFDPESGHSLWFGFGRIDSGGAVEAARATL